MPEFLSVPTSGMKWPLGDESLRWTSGATSISAVVLVLLCTTVGTNAACDGESETDDVDEQEAIRHAEVRARIQAEWTIAAAREWTLLHPDSDRQAHAREQLLYLEELEDQLVDPAQPDDEPAMNLEFDQLQQITGATPEDDHDDPPPLTPEELP